MRKGKRESRSRRLGAFGVGGLPGVCGSTRVFDQDSDPAHHERYGMVARSCGGRGWDAGLTGMCSVGRGNVFSFGANVFSFWPDVFTLAGQVFSFRWRALVGDRGRRDEGDVSTLSGQCVQFLARCVNFSAECVHFGGRCVQFLAGRSGWGWGADGRRDSSFGKLRTGRFGKLRTGLDGLRAGSPRTPG